ncbi:phosphatase PAP2 family protein [Chitinophaga sp. XS-30]|uniref:phosphatase PAP2 family protein n=1 Tax=Chitinophaga sp. XS-30 TaxID=2604421 RepID=UPI00143CD9DF|nr:phosphatase PAP2 family protein [Chitinophaga sp. XS-30]
MKTLVALVQQNRYFYVPFLLWLIIGGALLSLFTKDELFLTVNGAHHPVLDVLVTGTTYLGDGITFGVMLLVLLLLRKWKLFFMGAGTLLIVTLIVQGIKHAVNEPRPIVYFGDTEICHMVQWVKVHGGLSFPSGHTSTAFGMFCFLALIWRNKKMGALMFILGLITAHSRLYLSQHFFADVYVGSIIGTLVSSLIFWLFEYRRSQTTGQTNAHDTIIAPQPA